MRGPTTTPDRGSDALAEVRRLVVAVMGDEGFVEEDIDLSTSFNDDLEMESIEFVALGEALRDVYGEQCDFVGWIGGMDVDQIVDLSVRDLVEFVESQLAQTQAVP